jgi:hypothetical protein
MKAWDKMCTTDDILRVNKPERAIWVIMFEEADLVEAFCSPSRFELQVSAKPAHPEDIDLYRLGSALRLAVGEHKKMKDSNNSCIPVGMRILLSVLVGKHHDISMCAGIDCVLVSTAVVCCVVDTQRFVMINAIFDNAKLLSFSTCELPVAYTLQTWIYARKKVILEFRNKSLQKDSESTVAKQNIIIPRMQGPRSVLQAMHKCRRIVLWMLRYGGV